MYGGQTHVFVLRHILEYDVSLRIKSVPCYAHVLKILTLFIIVKHQKAQCVNATIFILILVRKFKSDIR